ncbi:MAG: hypothetical protein Q8908_14140 [Bacteroidota bacterium]|nr:hypothetical protein [Bacteroidota bacterium]
MQYIPILIMLSCIIIACSSTKQLSVKPGGVNTVAIAAHRDGSSFERAIIINEKVENKGVAAEYTWIRQNYPGCKLNGQLLSFQDKKPFDIIKIVTSEGKELSIFFDISNFFGKL